MKNLTIEFEQLSILDLLKLAFLDLKTYVIMCSIFTCYILVISMMVNNRHFKKKSKIMLHLLFIVLAALSIVVQCDDYSEYRKITKIKGSAYVFKAISLSSDYQDVWFRDKKGEAYHLKLDTKQGEIKQHGDKIQFDNLKAQHSFVSDDNNIGTSDIYDVKIVYNWGD